MPDYIVTEVVTYRVDDVADAEAAIRELEGAEQVDRDNMWTDTISRTAEDCSTPIGTREARAEEAREAAVEKFGDHATAKSAISKAFAQVEANEQASE